MIGEDKILSVMDGWGYYLHEKIHAGHLGYSNLLVAIREPPTRKHFDPELIILQLCDKNGAASSSSLKKKFSAQVPQPVCPGQINLYDRKNKRIDFFTFGGTLDAITAPDETIYWLHSSAPILEIVNDPANVADQLAAEVQLMLAVLKAHWDDDLGFAQRLGQLEPFQFYLAALESILMRYQQTSALKSNFHKLYSALLEEKDILIRTGQWPNSPVRLRALLSPIYQLEEDI